MHNLNRISVSYECHELKGKAFSPIVNSIRAYDTSPRSATRGRPCSVPYTRRTTQLRLSISSTAQDLLWRIHPFAGLRKTKRCMFLQRRVVAMRRKQTISGFVSKRGSCQNESRLIVTVDIVEAEKNWSPFSIVVRRLGIVAVFNRLRSCARARASHAHDRRARCVLDE